MTTEPKEPEQTPIDRPDPASSVPAPEVNPAVKAAVEYLFRKNAGLYQ